MKSVAEISRCLSLPWKTRILLWLTDFGFNLLLRNNGTVNRTLLNLGDFRTPPSFKPINGFMTYDVVVDVDPARKLWFRVFFPTQYAVEDLPLMVFFHGGGFVALSPDSKRYDDVCRKFARELHVVVVSVGYRLAPEHRHPAQLDDGFDVLKFLDDDENRSKWLPENANISRCFIVGDSSGGHIAHHVCLRVSEYKFRQLQVRLPHNF